MKLALTTTSLLALSVAGCAQFGAAAGIVAQAIPRNVDAAYKGLAGQPTVVMVWADPGVRLDNPLLQEDVEAAVQDALINVEAKDQPDALKGTTFPISTAVVSQGQQDHPEWETQSATDVAAQLKATRLVYLEVTDYATRSDASQELYRGTIKAHLSVIEMAPAGPDQDKVRARVAYDGGEVKVVFPKDSPKDGLPEGNDAIIGEHTITTFADEVAKRFYLHEEDRN